MSPILIWPSSSNIQNLMKPDCRLPADDPDLAVLVALHDESVGRRIAMVQATVRQPSGERRASARRSGKGRAEDDAAG